MSEHHAIIKWVNEKEDFSYKAYDRTHSWTFEGGTVIRASSAPEFLGVITFVNPEEAFVASLSSCHMLTFLAIASRKKFTVGSYTDLAKGMLEKNSAGRLAMTRVELTPEIRFTGEKIPDVNEIHEMHEMSHRECFIANSVHTEVTVKHR